MSTLKNNLSDNDVPIIVRGGGDLATGTVYRLRKAGLPVLVLETACPTTVRRAVSASEAVFAGSCMVEDMPCRLISDINDFDAGTVCVLVDPEGRAISSLRPKIVIDAIMAKRNTGTFVHMAPLTIGLGPGFRAPDDVLFAVETMRGHSLGRVITDGMPIPDTRRPGVIMGYGIERLLRAPAAGRLTPLKKIGDVAEAGETVGFICGEPVKAVISGVIRGLINPAVECTPDMKIGDIDPRGLREYCFTISDKSLSIAGGVMEAVSRFYSS
ncbi:MAG: selenium-dependent molybdenum cofactor biosynthesis protein YqeB [Cloacibacillus sp.]